MSQILLYCANVTNVRYQVWFRDQSDDESQD